MIVKWLLNGREMNVEQLWNRWPISKDGLRLFVPPFSIVGLDMYKRFKIQPPFSSFPNKNRKNRTNPLTNQNDAAGSCLSFVCQFPKMFKPRECITFVCLFIWFFFLWRTRRGKSHSHMQRSMQLTYANYVDVALLTSERADECEINTARIFFCV